MSMELNQLKREFAKHFVKFEEVLFVLYTAYQSNENVVLYGPPGHGKSEMSEFFFKCMGHKPYVKSMNSQSDVEDLFGPYDIVKYKEEGVMEHRIEDSFMSHEYVILEEGFDAPANILSSKKDVLTSKKFRNGSQVAELKTKMIVICTNLSKEEIAVNDSVRALTERFPLSLRVVWDSYNFQDFRELFEVTCPNIDIGYRSKMASIISKSMEKGHSISPRTAVKSLKMYTKSGIDCLRYIEGFNQSMINEILIDISEQEKMEKAYAKWRKVYNIVKDVPNPDKQSVIRYLQFYKVAEEVRNKLLDLRDVPDDCHEEYKNILKRWDKSKERLLNQSLKMVKSDSDLKKKYLDW